MRCFTVLIACGWLLLVAPKKPDGTFDPKSPLGDWEQVQFFDTANACNNAIARMFGREFIDKLSPAAKKYLEQGVPLKEAMAKAAIDSEPERRKLRDAEERLRGMTRCIPSDAIDFPLK